jgi:hypothetical protein
MTATKTTKKAGATKAKSGKKAKPEAGEKKLSALAAAAKVLGEKGTAMTCQELVGVMAAKGYWSSPGGKTPAATLYAGIIKEIETRGVESRFKKTAPGRFAAKDSPVTTAGADSPAKRGEGKKGKKAKTPTAAPNEAPAPETAA